MRIFGLVVFFILSSSFACDSTDEADSGTEFALAAVQDNILTTDYTALVEIEKTDTEDFAGDTPEDEEELVAVKYTAKVLETFLGPEHRNIVFTEYVVKSEGLEDLSSGDLIVSLCKDTDGNYYLPDIGFEMEASDALTAEASRFAKSTPAGSVCEPFVR